MLSASVVLERVAKGRGAEKMNPVHPKKLHQLWARKQQKKELDLDLGKMPLVANKIESVHPVIMTPMAERGPKIRGEDEEEGGEIERSKKKLKLK